MVKITSILNIHVWVSMNTISLHSSKCCLLSVDQGRMSSRDPLYNHWKFNSPSTLVFALMVTLGWLQPTAFSTLTLTSYSVEGERSSSVVETTSSPSKCISNGDAGSKAGRYSTTYPVMELPPSLVHATHFTDMEVEDVASTAKMVGAEGTNVCVIASKNKVGCQTPTLLHGK